MAYNPFQIWLNAAAQMRSLVRSGEKINEIASASNTVIEKRTRIMAEAASNPLAGDYAEIFRMVPEKVEAFSESGKAAVQAMMDMQDLAFANMQAMVAASSGKIPSMTAHSALMQRNMDVMHDAAVSMGRAIDPIHKTSTDNAKRLKKRKS